MLKHPFLVWIKEFNDTFTHLFDFLLIFKQLPKLSTFKYLGKWIILIMKEKGNQWLTEQLKAIFSLCNTPYLLRPSWWKNCFYWQHLNFQLHPSNRLGMPRSQDTACLHNVLNFVNESLHFAEVKWDIFIFWWLFWNWFSVQSRFLSFFDKFVLEGLRVELSLSALLHFEEEFLCMGSYLWASSGFDELFDFLPIFAIDSETWMDG